MIVYVTLYNRGTCIVRSANFQLLDLLRVWCDYTFLENPAYSSNCGMTEMEKICTFSAFF